MLKVPYIAIPSFLAWHHGPYILIQMIGTMARPKCGLREGANGLAIHRHQLEACLNVVPAAVATCQ